MSHGNENPRDARGWRIPKNGTKSKKIYDLLILGFKNSEVAKIIEHDLRCVRVLACNIKNPEGQSKVANNFYKANRFRLNDKAKKKRIATGKKVRTTKVKKRASSYVTKLVSILGMSYAEAEEIERKNLEKNK